MGLCSTDMVQVQVIDGRIVVNAASLTVQAQELQPFTRVVTGDQAQGLHTIQSAAAGVVLRYLVMAASVGAAHCLGARMACVQLIEANSCIACARCLGSYLPPDDSACSSFSSSSLIAQRTHPS
jgi:hypothetical protein